MGARRTVSPPASQPPGAIDLLLNGLAARATEGCAAGVAPLREALSAFRQDDGDNPANNRWLWVACLSPRTSRNARSGTSWPRAAYGTRETGALSVLPTAASYRAGVHIHAGEYAEASALFEEASAVTQATHTAPLVQAKQIVAAYRGNEAEALERLGERTRASGTEWALGIEARSRALLTNGPSAEPATSD